MSKLKSLLFPALISAMYFIAYKHDVAFFQALSWVFGIPMFIFSVIALLLTKEQLLKFMPSGISPLKKLSLIINSSLFLAFDLWATKGSQFFWLVLAIFINSVIAVAFAPGRKTESGK